MFGYYELLAHLDILGKPDIEKAKGIAAWMTENPVSTDLDFDLRRHGYGFLLGLLPSHNSCGDPNVNGLTSMTRVWMAYLESASEMDRVRSVADWIRDHGANTELAESLQNTGTAS